MVKFAEVNDLLVWQAEAVATVSQDFVYAKFSEFYKSSSAEIPLPSSVSQRE